MVTIVNWTENNGKSKIVTGTGSKLTFSNVDTYSGDNCKRGGFSLTCSCVSKTGNQSKTKGKNLF